MVQDVSTMRSSRTPHKVALIRNAYSSSFTLLVRPLAPLQPPRLHRSADQPLSTAAADYPPRSRLSPLVFPTTGGARSRLSTATDRRGEAGLCAHRVASDRSRQRRYCGDGLRAADRVQSPTAAALLSAVPVRCPLSVAELSAAALSAVRGLVGPISRELCLKKCP